MMNADHHSKTCVQGERVDNLYDRDIAEKAEINLLTKVAKQGFSSFSLAWLITVILQPTGFSRWWLS